MSDSQDGQEKYPAAMAAFQPSFASGELAPALRYRPDLAKWKSGAALMLNFYATPQGSVTRRPGLQYIGSAAQNGTVRLIPFQFSSTQQYVLEFGPNYIRFIYNAAYILSGSAPYQIATPYAAGELFPLRMVQSNDVLTIVHVNHPPMNLERLGATNWTLTNLAIGPGLPTPVGLGVVATAGSGFTTAPASLTYTYAITAVSTTLSTESPISAPVTVVNYDLGYYGTYGTLNTVQWPAVAGATNYNVYRLYQGVYAFVGSTANLSFQDINYTPDTAITPPQTFNPFAVGAIIGATITNGGTAYSPNAYITVTDSTGAGAVLQPVLTPTSGAVSGITIVDGGMGYTAPTLAFHDPGGNTIITSGTTTTTVFTTGSGAAATAQVQTVTNWPGAVGFFQERQVFGGSAPNPSTLWLSKSGNYTNFDVSDPVQDDDAITYTLASREANQIYHIIALTDLIIMTSAQGWRINGQNGPVTPSNFDSSPQTFVGAAAVDPIVIGNYILFVETKGSSVREIVYNLYANSYVSEDRSVLAVHLLLGHQIVSWCYCDTPHKVVWAVREDGVLLSLTYLKEQDVYAWAQHSTEGVFLSVCSVSETVNGVTEDVAYFSIGRTLQTGYTITVERMHSLLLGNYNDDVTQAWCVDCGLQYNEPGEPVTEVSGLGYLNAQTVAYLNDGVPGTGLVEGGTITLPTPGTLVTVGLPFTSTLGTLPLIPAPEAFGSHKRVHRVRIAVENTQGLVVSNSPSPDANAAQFLGVADDGSLAPIFVAEGVQEIENEEGWDRQGQLYIVQPGPLPSTVFGVGFYWDNGL